jgi:pyridoxal phosphate enzyme (YggS family)
VEFAGREGLQAVGENRVQEAAEKKARCGDLKVGWELIGSLQTNKARLAVQVFDRIQSVDRPKLVAALQRHCEEQGKVRFPVLLQVNAGNDPAKHGADPQDVDTLLDAALAAPALDVEGLMTIAPLSDDPDVARRTFRRLREIRDGLEARRGIRLPELSMGMTSDLEIAIEEGSTLVRVGTALFGER